MRAILHVDMDAFFASVEQLDAPELLGKPVVVGTRSPRGVVAAASYEARVSGVRSAMPMMDALRRCPEAVVTPPRFERYAEVSAAVFAIFRRYTPLVEGLSLDEAFLDVTGSVALFGPPREIAARVRADIAAELGLTASAGVATSKFVAKIASEVNKPNGLFEAPAELAAFLRPLPIERMWGVGPKSAARLREAGYRTFGNLADADETWLNRALGGGGARLIALSRGEDDRPVDPERETKSVGSEETFEVDLRTRAELEPVLLEHSAIVASRLVTSGLFGEVVTVKLKDPKHAVTTRQKHLPRAVADTDAIFEAAKELLGRFSDVERGVRLCGVAVSELRRGPPEPELFADPIAERRQKIEQVTAELRARFGEQGVQRARLLRPR